MRTLTSFNIAATLLTLLMIGCDQTLELNAPFERKLVVYAILSNRSETQTARITTTEPDFALAMQRSNTGEPGITVRITEGGVDYLFTDSLFVPDSIHLFVAYNLQVETGKEYSLAVHSPSLGTVTSSLTPPSQGRMFVDNPESLEVVDRVARFPVGVTLGANGAAFILRFYVEFEYMAGTELRTERIEVPWRAEGGVSDSTRLTYPSILGRGQSQPFDARWTDGASFSGDAYRYVIGRIKGLHSADGLRFRNAVFHLTQIDYPLYAYYSTVNGFPGSGSLRLDEPDFTNIVGGHGVFGSERVDEYSLALTPSL